MTQMVVRPEGSLRHRWLWRRGAKMGWFVGVCVF